MPGVPRRSQIRPKIPPATEGGTLQIASFGLLSRAARRVALLNQFMLYKKRYKESATRCGRKRAPQIIRNDEAQRNLTKTLSIFEAVLTSLTCPETAGWKTRPPRTNIFLETQIEISTFIITRPDADVDAQNTGTIQARNYLLADHSVMEIDPLPL